MAQQETTKPTISYEIEYDWKGDLLYEDGEPVGEVYIDPDELENDRKWVAKYGCYEIGYGHATRQDAIDSVEIAHDMVLYDRGRLGEEYHPW